ncbi:hypothetical protein MHB77_30500 [Paenibacillus sp. FSL K6-3166]|uniref:hypothetical protein n=1 Tax=Paenibacillus sp. FSL K6-3166 TaxID=2921492 RepID=UPI0030FA7509
MGKSIYLSEYELNLLAALFSPGNYSCEGREDEEKRMEAAENIRAKAERALDKKYIVRGYGGTSRYRGRKINECSSTSL